MCSYVYIENENYYAHKFAFSFHTRTHQQTCTSVCVYAFFHPYMDNVYDAYILIHTFMQLGVY